MLKLATRPVFNTLMDAIALKPQDNDRPALIYVASDAPTRTISRAEFRLQIVIYANALTRLGIRARDLVVIAHTQNLESIYVFWAALYIGAVPSMFPTLTEKLDPDIYMNSLAELVRLSQVRAIFTTDDFAEQLRPRVLCGVYGTADLLADTGMTVGFYRAQAYEIAFLQHSSGTTGLQKGVALSHESVLNQLASYSDALGLRGDDIIVSWLPLYHDMGLIAGFILPLVQGLPLVLMSPFDWVRHPALLLRAIHDTKATLCWLPNFAYNHMARRVRERESEGLSLASMRAFINCSEPVRADSHALFLERFAANGVTPQMLQVSYAMAENTFAVTQTALGEAVRHDRVDSIALQEKLRAIPASSDAPQTSVHVSCGQPIANVGIKIVGDTGQILEERMVGEIYVTSDCMLTEYYMRPDLQPFDGEGWYHTGDRGYLADGHLYVIGRSKDLIINAGKNVYPQDLEAIVNMIEGVHPGRAVAFGVPDDKEGTELIAIVAEVDTADPEARKRINQQVRLLVAQQTDVTVNFVTLVDAGWLIKTSSGKISRPKNRDKWLAERAR
jgi:acyl-CoA synthetase (AMP-forming)/AMP-acid ligase II